MSFQQALRRVLFGGTLLVLASATFAQLSQDEAEQARATRMAAFRLLSHNMEPIAGMARGRVPFDAALAERNARNVVALSRMIPDLFETDTRDTGIYTRAKDFIWDNWDSFEAHAEELTRNASLMVEAAASGDQNALSQAMRRTGPACGACHDLFRFQESDPALPVPKPL